jgi:ribulose-phosphate 3-epimerase
MIQIVPAILDKTEEEFENHLEALKSSHSFQEGWVHIDFADNEFVPNKTLGVAEVNKFEIPLRKEAHLMVAHPLEWIEALKGAGFERVVFHYESKDNPEEVIEKIKEYGMEAGIAINPITGIEVLEKLKDSLVQVLVMGIIPGFQGQPFIPGTIEKIKVLKSKNWPVKISTDGAVSDLNAKDLVNAGVDQLVIGSFLFKSGDIDENAEKIWETVSGS